MGKLKTFYKQLIGSNVKDVDKAINILKENKPKIMNLYDEVSHIPNEVKGPVNRYTKDLRNLKTQKTLAKEDRNITRLNTGAVGAGSSVLGAVVYHQNKKAQINNMDKAEKVFEKLAKEKDQKTYPISRALTSPVAGGIVGGLYGGAGLAVNPITRKYAPIGAVLGAGYGAGVHTLGRALYGRAQKGRANLGQKGLTESDQDVIKALKKNKK